MLPLPLARRRLLASQRLWTFGEHRGDERRQAVQLLRRKRHQRRMCLLEGLRVPRMISTGRGRSR
jgi:hypothetical protein